jgi:hypothetical protein
MNIEISYRDDEPSLLSQSLTGSASTRLALGAARRQGAIPATGPRRSQLRRNDVARSRVTRSASTSLGRWRASSTGSGADQIASTVAPTTQCNDVARIGQFRDLSRFGNFGCTPWGTMGKARERQIILKTDQRNILLGMGPEGNSPRSQAVGTRTGSSSGMASSRSAKNGRWVMAHLPTGRPPEGRFPTE